MEQLLQQLGLDHKLDLICDVLAGAPDDIWNHAAHAAALLLPFSPTHVRTVMPRLTAVVTNVIGGAQMLNIQP